MIQFYDKIAKKLFNPLINFEESLSKIDLLTKSEIFKYQKLVELISFISNEHSRDYSRSFILENNLLVGISKLISNLKFPLQLRLSAIRCIKFIILLDDEFYTRYIIKFNLLNSTMEFFNKINNINNLSNSTILNLLYLILENENLINFKLLKNYLTNNFYNILNSNYQGRKLIESNNSSINSYNHIDDDIENGDEIDELDELDELDDEEEEEEEGEDEEEEEEDEEEGGNGKVKYNNDDEIYDEEEDDVSASVVDIHDGSYNTNKVKNNKTNKNKNKRKIDEDVSIEVADTDEENNKRGKNSNNGDNGDGDGDGKHNGLNDNIDEDDDDDIDDIDELQMTSPDVIPESDEEIENNNINNGDDTESNANVDIENGDSANSIASTGEITKESKNSNEVENQPLESSDSTVSSSSVVINDNESDIQENKHNNNNLKKFSESNSNSILNNNSKEPKELLIDKEN
ncbi:unnamed protein product [[Candida] boidinii]|nr:unnamed protein product [[Candida] boidinii]